MTRRPALIWLTFALFLALTLGAMGWMTRTVLRLDQAQARATAAAQLEENVRLALWRMDGAIAPIISQETSRPYFEYSPMFPAERAYTRMYTELKSGDVLVPSPLLKPTSSYILLHFQIDPDGNVSSPQAPIGNVRKLAESGYTTAADIAAAEERMGRVRSLVQQDRAVFAGLPPPTDAQIWAANRIRVTANGSLSNTAINRDAYANNGVANQQAQSPNFDVRQQEAVQQQRSRQEYAAR